MNPYVALRRLAAIPASAPEANKIIVARSGTDGVTTLSTPLLLPSALGVLLHRTMQILHL